MERKYIKNGNTHTHTHTHTYELEEIIFLKYLYYPKESEDLMQCLSKYP